MLKCKDLAFERNCYVTPETQRSCFHMFGLERYITRGKKDTLREGGKNKKRQERKRGREEERKGGRKKERKKKRKKERRK